MGSNKAQGIDCPHCKSSHPIGTQFCPNTGKPLQERASSRSIIVFASIIIFFIISFAVYQMYFKAPDDMKEPYDMTVKIGDLVKIKKNIQKPCEGWGDAKPGDTGTVLQTEFRGNYLKIKLSSGRKWIACPKDIEKIK